MGIHKTHWTDLTCRLGNTMSSNDEWALPETMCGWPKPVDLIYRIDRTVLPQLLLGCYPSPVATWHVFRLLWHINRWTGFDAETSKSTDVRGNLQWSSNSTQQQQQAETGIPVSGLRGFFHDQNDLRGNITRCPFQISVYRPVS